MSKECVLCGQFFFPFWNLSLVCSLCETTMDVWDDADTEPYIALPDVEHGLDSVQELKKSESINGDISEYIIDEGKNDR